MSGNIKCSFICFIRLFCNFCEMMLFVLTFCFLPTKGDYEKIDMNNELNETIKINQTILGLSIILFIYIFFFMIFQFCDNCENCSIVFVIFKLILSFIVWALSIAIISNINKILDLSDIYFHYALKKLDKIKHEHIIQLICILSANLLLNIFDFFVITCCVFSCCCQEKTYYSSTSNSYPNKVNKNNAIKGTAIITKVTLEVKTTTTINN